MPDVLLSGHHAEIERWRRDQALERTRRHRPDLLKPSPDANAPERASKRERSEVSGAECRDSRHQEGDKS